MASRILKYSVFLRKYRTPLLITCCGGVFAANMFHHVFPGVSYRLFYQAWYHGGPATLSDNLEGVFQQVLKDYGISSPNSFSAFPSSGFHPISAGVPWLPAGAHIGLPLNFNSTADDLSGITKHTVAINDKTVEWSSDCGTALKEALVFSLEAQKFVIAREVSVLQSGGPVVSAAVAPFCLGGVWVYSVVMKQVFQLHTGPLLLRAAVNILALGIGAVSYFFTSDAVNQWIDYSSDRHAAGVSRDYAKGGVEFYEKILSRNRALRSLMGEKGRKTFAPSGNLLPAHFLQMKHTPYTSRRDRILAVLKEQKA